MTIIYGEYSEEIQKQDTSFHSGPRTLDEEVEVLEGEGGLWE